MCFCFSSILPAIFSLLSLFGVRFLMFFVWVQEMRSVRGFEPDDPRVVITATWLERQIFKGTCHLTQKKLDPGSCATQFGLKIHNSFQVGQIWGAMISWIYLCEAFQTIDIMAYHGNVI